MARSEKTTDRPAYGRGTGVPDPIDVHVGSRIRTRRLLRDMNQEELAQALGVTFQQVQKYESGANRISASMLWQTSLALDAPISYFYDGLVAPEAEEKPTARLLRERLTQAESIELIRHYYAIPAAARGQFLEMLKAVGNSPDRRD